MMGRNSVLLVSLILGQLTVAYILKVTPPLVDWSWEVRLTVAVFIFVAGGAAAFSLFVGPLRRRVAWVALSAGLPSVIAELISWSDAAYPHLGYLIAIATAAFGALGALCALPIVARYTREEKAPS